MKDPAFIFDFFDLSNDSGKFRFRSKQDVRIQSCRGGLGEAPYNTPRHSSQRMHRSAEGCGYTQTYFVQIPLVKDL